MKWVNRLAATLLGLIGVGIVRDFFNKYEVVVFNKEDLNDDSEDQNFNAMDLRGTPTHVCVCGSNQFYIRAVFDNYEIAQYFLDMQCVSCGNLATAPTLVDKENME